jgi:signal transduction histidine kinase
MTIPAILVFFIRRKKDAPFPFVFWLFGAFILLCGMTHLLEVITTHVPVYRLSGLVKVATGAVSLATVGFLVPIVPKALALRTPEGLEREVRDRTADLDRANKALQEAHDQMEARVHERTADLETANAALRAEMGERARVEADLRRSNQELDRFAAVASHDLQEPLRKIRQFGDLLLATNGSLDGSDHARRMQFAAERMQKLIDDLLQLAQVTSGAKPFVRVDLGRLAREVLGDLEPRVRQTRARVDVGELPTIDADPTQVRQLMQNLIGNALKFHRPGEPPTVEVRGRVVPGPAGDVCELTVADRGIGFKPEYRERIFNVFERLHGRDKFEGTGIGLAVCRKVVERHGGTITAEGEPDRGARFVVRLPLRQAGTREAA